MKKHLDLPTPKTILWTDSQCILHWLKTKKLLSVFVENRLKEIRNGNITLRFVISENNNTLKRLPRQAAQEARLRLGELMNANDETI